MNDTASALPKADSPQPSICNPVPPQVSCWAAFVGDALSRRHPAGRLQVVIWGLLGCAPFALATFAAHSLPLLKISACGFGLFAGFLMANMFSALYDVSGPRNYGLATGVMNAIGGLGAGAAILIAGIWKSSIGIEPLMLGCLVLSMSCAVVLFLVIMRSSKRELAR